MVPTFHYGEARYPLSVVVLSHNRLDELTRNLPELIRHCAQLGYELILADNASNDELRSYLATATASQPHVTVIYNETNLGVAGGRNATFALASGEFVLSIDDDTRVSCEVLRDLPALMRDKYPKVGILALRVKHPADDQEQNYAGDHDVPVGNHHGAACVIRREVLARIGGMDDYCDFGIEERDICIRAHAAGYQILYTPEVVVYHNSFQRPGREGFDRQQKWVFNNARTNHKYFPFSIAFVFNTRYFLWTTRGMILHGHFVSFFRLLWAHLRGTCVGLLHREPVPPATVAYYADPNLFPEVGNKPCISAGIKRYLRKRIPWGGKSSAERPLDPLDFGRR
jgi:GT2 family glycosyltransferase